MKKFIQLSLIILVLTFIMSACTMQKRVYMSGYNVEWKKGSPKNDNQGLAENKTKNEAKPISESNVEPVTKTEQSKALITADIKENSYNLTASVDNTIIPLGAISSQQKEFDIISSAAEDCDNIILRNGDEIKAKVTEITTDEIKYHKCDNLTGPLYSMKKSEVFMIKYANGTKDIITPNNSTATTTTTTSPNNSTNSVTPNYSAPSNNTTTTPKYDFNNKTQKNNGDKRSGAFGIVSFICGILGLLVGAIILGPIAMIFGIIGMINRKLTGLAIAGFILGVIDTIFGILVLLAVIAAL